MYSVERIHKVWPTWLLVGGLVAAFLGERVFVASEAARMVLAIVAVVTIVGAIVVRLVDFMGAPSHKLRVARLLFATTLGVGVALIIYALIPLVFTGDGALHVRARSACWAVWPVVLAASALPLFAVEAAVAPVAYIEAYEHSRIRGAFERGLAFALLLGVLFLANFLANRHDVKWELSAGHHAVASDQTLQAVRDLTKPVKVVLFFPRANEVAESLERYLRPLLAANSNLTVERVDHALATELAKETKIKENGYVALLQDKATENIRVGTKASSAQSALRRFDSSFLKGLIKVTTGKKVAYFTTGHDERETGTPHADDKRAPVKLLKRQLEAWQFTVKTLSLAEGLAEKVPDDASIVFIMGPEKPFLPAESQALVKALDHGVRIFLALEPEREGDAMEDFLAAIGLEFDKTMLGNIRSNAPLTRTERDVRHIWSNRYSSHASLTNVTRNPNKLFAVFDGAGALKKKEDTKVDRLKTDIVLTTVPDTFGDVNGNLKFDGDTEKSENFGLAAAVTKTSTSGKKADEARVFVISDADVLADEMIKLIVGNGYLMADVVQWLAKDEEAVVPTIVDEDIKIVHKKEEDSAIFFGTIFGVPALVVLLGFFMNRKRRR